MIKLKNISKSYGQNVVIDNIDLDIPEGKLITLLGPNGVGKSTLLRIIAGSESPDHGIVTYKDHALSEFNFPFVGEIGFVHELINYWVPFSVQDFVERLSQGCPSWDQEYFEYLVRSRAIDLSGVFQSYSRGQKMQIALMINLAMRPKLLLLDEISSVIDVYGRKFFFDELQKFVKNGATVVITTNIINELEFYTDHLLILIDKKIQVNTPISQLSGDFIKLRKRRDEEHPIFEDDKCIWAGINSDHSTSFIVEKELTEKYKLSLDYFDKRKSTLEDVFIYYFTKEVK